MNAKPTENKPNGQARLRSSLKAGLRDLFHVDGLLDLNFPVGKPPHWTGWFFMLMTAAGFWWLFLTLWENGSELLKWLLLHK